MTPTRENYERALEAVKEKTVAGDIASEHKCNKDKWYQTVFTKEQTTAIQSALQMAIDPWQPIETAPKAQQVLIYEPMYGCLLCAKTAEGVWQIKSSGNFWRDLPESVVPSLWQTITPPTGEKS